MIKSFIKSLILSCLFFVASGVVAVSALAAPRLYFDPSTATPKKGEDFQVKLQIDVENQSAFGADTVINFPQNDITVKSITNGGFFSDFSSAQSNGRLELHGYFSALFDSRTGNGTFAILTLNSNKDSGTGTIGMVCSGSGSDTFILDSNGQNILTCNSLNQLNLTYASSGSSIPVDGPTNACGGTCGSIYNCNVNLFCYQGFCRNPDCPSDLSCGCTATPTPAASTPRPKPKSTPASGASPTPPLITLAKVTPFPTYAPQSPAPTTPAQNALNARNIIIIAGVALAALAIVLVAVNALKKKNPPQITPPTSSPVQPPFPTTI